MNAVLHIQISSSGSVEETTNPSRYLLFYQADIVSVQWSLCGVIFLEALCYEITGRLFDLLVFQSDKKVTET